MAMCICWVCNSCSKEIHAWSDGNPYYIDENGEKQYAYHPDHDALDRCIGNDSPHLCLECGEEFMVDSRAPTEACPKCGAKEFADTKHNSTLILAQDSDCLRQQDELYDYNHNRDQDLLICHDQDSL